MTIRFENDRAGQTVYPELKDDATGLPIEGSAEVVDTRVANLAKEDLNYNGQSPETYEDVSDLTEQEATDADPDYVPEGVSVVELSDLSDEIHSASVSPDETLASSILNVDMGDKAADVAVQYFSHKVYDGQMTPEEAFQAAVGSGLPPEALAVSFRKLQNLLK